jgi:protein-tyrosine phosphatase
MPNPSFEQSWRAISVPLASIVREGGRVAVHCRDGRTRAGMVAALLLVEVGCAPQDAINRVRAARPGALDGSRQEEYVRAQTPPRSADLYQLELLEPTSTPGSDAEVRTEMVAEPIQVRFARQG